MRLLLVIAMGLSLLLGFSIQPLFAEDLVDDKQKNTILAMAD